MSAPRGVSALGGVSAPRVGRWVCHVCSPGGVVVLPACKHNLTSLAISYTPPVNRKSESHVFCENITLKFYVVFYLITENSLRAVISYFVVILCILFTQALNECAACLKMAEEKRVSGR